MRKKSSYSALKVALEAAESTGDVKVELVEMRGEKSIPASPAINACAMASPTAPFMMTIGKTFY